MFSLIADEGINELNQSKEEFDDEETWVEIKDTGTESSSEAETDDTMSDIHPLITSTPPYKMAITKLAKERVIDDVMGASPPTSSLVSKLFPQLKQKQHQVQLCYASVVIYSSFSHVVDSIIIKTISRIQIIGFLFQINFP